MVRVGSRAISSALKPCFWRRTSATAMPTLRFLDIAVLGSDRRRGAGRRHIRRRGHRGHGAEAADLEVHATVELLALLARVVAECRLGAEGHDLDRRLRHAQLDEELLDRVRAPLREHLVVDRFFFKQKTAYEITR